MNKPIEKIVDQKCTVEEAVSMIVRKINELIEAHNARFPEEGEEERCVKCNNPFLHHHNQHRINGKPYHTGCAKKAELSYQDGYDAGAAEATQVCNDKTVPQAYEKGKEDAEFTLKNLQYETGYATGVYDMKTKLRKQVKSLCTFFIDGQENQFCKHDDILKLLS